MPDLGTDLLLRLKEGFCYDLTLICEGGEQLQVHKFVLGSRSDVFMSMVETDMKERLTGNILIEDFNLEVVSEFVNYLYSDKMSDDITNLTELLKIAHKYQVFGLVEECVKRLIEEVTVDNVVQLATLAEALQTEKLSTKCSEVLADNLENMDIKELDSLPSSLFRKSFMAFKAKAKTQNCDRQHYDVANFFTGPGTLENCDINMENIVTAFNVNRNTLLSGVGVHVFGDSIPILLELYEYGSERIITSIRTNITSTDSLKRVKIYFPPVDVGPEKDYRVKVKLEKQCLFRRGDKAKRTVSLNLAGEELIVDIVKNSSLGIPVSYFEE